MTCGMKYNGFLCNQQHAHGFPENTGVPTINMKVRMRAAHPFLYPSRTCAIKLTSGCAACAWARKSEVSGLGRISADSPHGAGLKSGGARHFAQRHGRS